VYSRKYKSKHHRGLIHGYRSGLEEVNLEWVGKCLGLDSTTLYECMKIPYFIPQTQHVYTPDIALPNGIIVETKGRFTAADRQKHLYVKQQHPELDIRFVFSNSKTKIRKGSKTSYADWCNKNGFLYAEKLVPKEWLSAAKSK
jgi:hypothetical protein